MVSRRSSSSATPKRRTILPSPLSSKGKARAVELAKLLRNANIAAIYSSEFQRTVKTAEPLAQQLTLEIKKEFTGSADDFAKLLAARHANDIVLVVGHSNTVPALLESLGFPRVHQS